MDCDNTLHDLLSKDILTEKELYYLNFTCLNYDCEVIQMKKYSTIENTSESQIIKQLKNIIPMSWIDNCLEILDENDFSGLHWYSSECGMRALRKIRTGKELSEEEEFKLYSLSNEFRLMPKTNKQFTVFRGIYEDSTFINNQSNFTYFKKLF